MYYEINVSLNGQHLFATHPRSLRTREEARRVYDLLSAAFPESKGYLLSLSKHEECHRTLSRTDLE